MKYDSFHFDNEVELYVPCFQKNPQSDKDGYPTFRYELQMASTDQQMVASMDPDYILVLRGRFDAKTQPFDLGVIAYNTKSGEWK